MPSGQTREEWKAQVEASKLLGFPVAIDGLCVRVGSIRCHAHAMTVKLRRPIAVPEVEAMLAACPNVGATPILRLPDALEGNVQKAMDMGMLGIIVPTVDDALEAREAARLEAESELAAYRTRLTGDAWHRALSINTDRLLRERYGVVSVFHHLG